MAKKLNGGSEMNNIANLGMLVKIGEYWHVDASASDAVWELQLTIVVFIRDYLRLFADNAHTYPVEMSYEEWVSTLRDTADKFDSLAKELQDERRYDVVCKGLDEALEAFKGIFPCLWD